MAKQILQNDWAPLLENEFKKPYYQELREFLKEEYETKTIYPPKEAIFNALHLTPYENVKVVILGQDPYHGPNQAHGLSFSVQPGIKPPPSLKNIFKELQADLNCPLPDHGFLQQWAESGVLLLNTVLTVQKGQAHSHRGKGWETFTDRVIQTISERENPAVFILWGKPAQTKKELIDESKHVIIESPHPSPFSASRGFFGSRPFSRANEALVQMGEEPVNWCLNNLP